MFCGMGQSRGSKSISTYSKNPEFAIDLSMILSSQSPTGERLSYNNCRGSSGLKSPINDTVSLVIF